MTWSSELDKTTKVWGSTRSNANLSSRVRVNLTTLEYVLLSFSMMFSIMISMRMEIMSLNIDQEKSIVRRLLRAINVVVLNSDKTLNIVYVSYLTKEFEKQKCYFIVVEFEDFTTINRAIIRELVWFSVIHQCERYILNYKVEQCHNYSSYKHIEVQCLFETRCKRCVSKKYIKKIYTSNVSRCCVCQTNEHHVWMKTCSRRKKERDVYRRNTFLNKHF